MPVINNDPFGSIKATKDQGSPEPRVVNEFHHRSDKDSAPTAQHHTLGTQRNQAAPGDHIHNGVGGRLLGEGEGLTVTGLLAPATVAELNAVVDSLFAAILNFADIEDART